MFKRALICVLVALVISGCSRSAGTPQPSPSPVVIATIGVDATALPGIQPVPAVVTPTPSVSPTPFVSFTVKPNVDSLKLRSNPGLTFIALILVQQTDNLTVIGAAPGGQWLNVKTESGTEGWVFAQFVTSSVDLTQIPVIQPKDVEVIKGHVTDASGAPMAGVGFDLNQGVEPHAYSDSVVTDAGGNFYSFVPTEATGSWTVTFSSLDCKSPVWADSTCKTYKAGYTGTVDPVSQAVTVPQGATLLNFTLK